VEKVTLAVALLAGQGNVVAMVLTDASDTEVITAFPFGFGIVLCLDWLLDRIWPRVNQGKDGPTA
jgi:hypothetical protein